MNTPFFSIQYLLREFSIGLGTKKLAAKKIDDACKKTEINPHDLQTLKNQLIHEPLSKYVNVYFADHVLAKIEEIFELYISFVKDIYLDGVNSHKAQELIKKYFISYAITRICTSNFGGMRITPQELAIMNISAMRFTMDMLRKGSEWQEYEMLCDKAQKDKFRKWANGKNAELPDLTGIASLGKKWERGNSWGTIKARLVISRLWDYSFYKSQICDLNIVRVMNFDTENYIYQMVDTFKHLQQSEAIKYSQSTPIARELFKLLQLSEPKTSQNKNACAELLKQLKEYQQEHDLDNETTYFWYWMNARYYLYCGELDTSIDCYINAFEYGYTPLMLAVEFDEVELVEYMLESKNKADLWSSCINSQNNQRVNLRKIAFAWRSEKVMQLLDMYGVN